MLYLFSALIGDIDSPPQFGDTGEYADNVVDQSNGLLALVSNIIKLVIILGGITTFINIILAGFYYIIYGYDSQQLTKVHQKIYMSLIGLAVMVGSFVIAGIAGWMLFGDPTAILSPSIYGPGL